MYSYSASTVTPTKAGMTYVAFWLQSDDLIAAPAAIHPRTEFGSESCFSLFSFRPCIYICSWKDTTTAKGTGATSAKVYPFMVDLFQYFLLSSSEYGSALVFLDLSGGVVWWGAGLKGVYAALGKRSALAAANISSNLLIYSSRQSSDDRSLPKVISSLALLGGVGFDNEYSYLPSIILWYTVWKNCPVFYLIHGF